MAVTKRLRFEVLRRDHFRCYYCGIAAIDSPLAIDHVVPRALGGRDELENLVAACRDCNIGKTSTAPGPDLVESVSSRTTHDRMARELWNAIAALHHETLDVDMAECTCAEYCGRWECRFAYANYMSGWIDCRQIASLEPSKEVENARASMVQV